MKLYCAYDKSENPEFANRCCDMCGKLLCKICGYNKGETDYCNECWSEEQSNNHFTRLKVELKNK